MIANIAYGLHVINIYGGFGNSILLSGIVVDEPDEEYHSIFTPPFPYLIFSGGGSRVNLYALPLIVDAEGFRIMR